jgi:hypothetical protein
MLSVNDLPFIFSLNHFIVNKFILDKEPVTYQCLEEWYDFKLRNKPVINNQIYCNVLKKYSNISLCDAIETNQISNIDLIIVSGNNSNS